MLAGVVEAFGFDELAEVVVVAMAGAAVAFPAGPEAGVAVGGAYVAFAVAGVGNQIDSLGVEQGGSPVGALGGDEGF